ncbi:MBL fold metallo-hydrolase [Hyphobacterium sp. HN65]|uniref:MBL fold metallo-hydrolase n=1 Tax=Hyphobacterium lacteum TaxID=3116575 RepID=A0ABU7LMG4_9PROT|nr:MBL fold metallo-hydrolase [Hyphobacterium sp. HN65]MEE2525120.1 MBL fold metallo-hydrolase [Hyphobacterium sp. HN65]
MIGFLAAAALQMTAAEQCDVELVVLGVGQDGGIPQINVQADPAWEDESLRHRVVSLGVVDHESGTRYLFEATPDFREQVHDLNAIAGTSGAPDGIFLTHAHIGHYTGLMFLGFESMSADNVPVFAPPRMQDFLTNSGPWSQLIAYGNIRVDEFQPGPRPHDVQPGEPDYSENPIQSMETSRLRVDPLHVPHRREFADTVGYRIQGPEISVIFIPDIDSWEEWAEWGTRIEDIVMENDLVYVDATFFDDHELPGRDMSAIPHPRVTETMDLFQDYPDEIRQRIRFIHYNHTNPIRYDDSAETQEVLERGYRIAREGERICL